MRRTAKRSRIRRRFRRYKRRYYRPNRRLRKSYTKALHVIRRNSPVTITHNAGATGIPYLSATSFNLDQVTGVTDLKNLYQEFRINCVVCTFYPVANMGNYTSQSSPLYNIPIFGWAYDYNDDTVPSTLNNLRQFQNYRERPFIKPISFKVFPAPNLRVYNGPFASDGFAVKRKMWLRTASSSNTPYYGIKFGVWQCGQGQTVFINACFKYYLSFKGLF